jgi:hypothetical protein
MRQLRFVALAEDGRSVVVSDDTGERFRLGIDERLKAAARGDAAGLGQLEIHMDGTMRPAEIQARVRAGESPEELARQASMPLDRLLRFAGPVLAERTMVAEQAQRTRCRPVPGEEPVVLGEVVTRRLVERGIDPDTAEWDAARRDNGTWRVQLDYPVGKGSAGASWIYDPMAKHVTPHDDAARTLLAEPLLAADEPSRPERPFSVVRGVEQPAAQEPVEEPSAAEPYDDEHAAASGDGSRPARNRRPDVPAWDDIVFGARKG